MLFIILNRQKFTALRKALINTSSEPKVFSVCSYALSPYGYTRIATPTKHIERLPSSCLLILSPKKRKAIMVAKIGDVLFKNASFDNEISLTAVLKMKKVIVPVTDLIMTSFH